MNIGNLHLEKPIMNASGTLSKENLEEVKGIYGALVTKTVTLEPREGNPPPRVMEVPCGMLNSIGLQNSGIEKFLEEELDEWDVGLPVIVSVFARNQLEVSKVCKLLNKSDVVSGVEVNLSCPNTDPVSEIHLAIGLCRHSLPDKPMIVKLGYENALERARVAARWKADALTLINTIPAYTGPPRVSEPMLGGYSGPGIKPIALRAVYEVSRQVDVPVIGCGGAGSAEDIEEFMRAGAAAVQIGSASFVRDVEEIVGTSSRKGEST